MSLGCNKCGAAVPSSNDAVIFDALLTGNSLIALFGVPRHLLPVIEDSVVVCEGSPSRAQYIEGQLRDQRGDYPYDEAQEPVMRAAYAAMQERAVSPA
jgi:hypothetical protein